MSAAVTQLKVSGREKKNPDRLPAGSFCDSGCTGARTTCDTMRRRCSFACSPHHPHLFEELWLKITFLLHLVCPPRIIQRTIRAAVEQHLFELKTSVDQDLGGYDSQGWAVHALISTLTHATYTNTETKCARVELQRELGQKWILARHLFSSVRARYVRAFTCIPQGLSVASDDRREIFLS